MVFKPTVCLIFKNKLDRVLVILKTHFQVSRRTAEHLSNGIHPTPTEVRWGTGRLLRVMDVYVVVLMVGGRRGGGEVVVVFGGGRGVVDVMFSKHAKRTYSKRAYSITIRSHNQATASFDCPKPMPSALAWPRGREVHNQLGRKRRRLEVV